MGGALHPTDDPGRAKTEPPLGQGCLRRRFAIDYADPNKNCRVGDEPDSGSGSRQVGSIGCQMVPVLDWPLAAALRHINQGDTE